MSENICPVHKENDLVCGIAVGLEQDILRNKILDLKLKLAQLLSDDKEKIIAGLMADKARLTNANEELRRRLGL